MAAVLKTSEDVLVFQTRSFGEQQFAQLCKQVMNMIAGANSKDDCVQVLRDLYRYIACSMKRRRIPDELVKQLKNLIIETGKSSRRFRLLAMLILREISPTIAYNIKLSNISADVNWLALLFPLIFAQGEELGHISSHTAQFMRWVKSTSGFNFDLQHRSLVCLNRIQSSSQLLNEDQVNDISSFMVKWLSTASNLSAPNPYQRKLFSTSKQKLQPVTELNGGACNSFFTVMNLAQYYFADQLLNIQTFSMLKQWLYNTWSFQQDFGQVSLDISKNIGEFDSPATSFSSCGDENSTLETQQELRTPGIDDFDDLTNENIPHSDSPSLSDQTERLSITSDSIHTGMMVAFGTRSMVDNESDNGSNNSSTGNLSQMRQTFGSQSSVLSDVGYTIQQSTTLPKKSIGYCYRLLRQSECKPSTIQDRQLRKACIIEAIGLLDFFCAQEKSLVPKSIQAVRRIYTMVKLWPGQTIIVLLPMLRFFINHGETVMLDADVYCKFYFDEILANCFSSSEVAFETVSFCRNNLAKLKETTKIFSEFFPNLFKILAWFPRTFVREFIEILPVIISEKTFVEVFHYLLDLPCLSAALETVKHIVNQKDSNLVLEAPSGFKKAIIAYHNAEFKPLFLFLLRNEAGMADTIDKLDILHDILEDCFQNTRVIVCSQVSCLMLRVYFQTVLFNNQSSMFIKKLFPIILERVTVLSNIETYKKNVQSLFADELLVIFKKEPSIIVDYSNEIIEFINEMKSLEIGFEHFFTNLIWVVGEYASGRFDERCGNQLIIQFHEAIESVTYELTSTTNSVSTQEIFSSRFVCVLMSALAKLACRCQDLIPKVVLCLQKVAKIRAGCCLDVAEKQTLLVRADELINLLSLPNIAPLILSPDSMLDERRAHTDRNISHSFFLMTTKVTMFS